MRRLLLAALTVLALVARADAYSVVVKPAGAVSTLLATTSQTSVAAFTPSPNAVNCKVSSYVVIATAPTTLTVTITWTDSAGAQSMFWSATSWPVGSYALADIPITSASGSAVTVLATAGTANQATVSASMWCSQ